MFPFLLQGLEDGKKEFFEIFRLVKSKNISRRQTGRGSSKLFARNSCAPKMCVFYKNSIVLPFCLTNIDISFSNHERRTAVTFNWILKSNFYPFVFFRFNISKTRVPTLVQFNGMEMFNVCFSIALLMSADIEDWHFFVAVLLRVWMRIRLQRLLLNTFSANQISVSLNPHSTLSVKRTSSQTLESISTTIFSRSVCASIPHSELVWGCRLIRGCWIDKIYSNPPHVFSLHSLQGFWLKQQPFGLTMLWNCMLIFSTHQLNTGLILVCRSDFGHFHFFCTQLCPWTLHIMIIIKRKQLNFLSNKVMTNLNTE